DPAEALRRIYRDLRGQSIGQLKQLLRYGSIQIESPGRDSTRWRSFPDRRQHTPEFDRVPRGHSNEREIPAELYGPSECAIVCGIEQSRQDLRREIWLDPPPDRYSSYRGDDPSESLQHSFESYRFRARGHRATLSGRLPQSR